MLVTVNGAMGGEHSLATVRGRWVYSSPQFRPVFNAGNDAGDAFVIQRPPFPAAGDCVGIGANFVGLQPFQMLALAIEDAHVGSKEFVGRANQEVAIEGADVDRPVWRVMYRIDVRHGAGFARQPNNVLHMVDGPYRI